MAIQTHITPKTEESLKRLAKRIARDEGVPHMAALDMAARQAGAASYKDFMSGGAVAPSAAKGEDSHEVKILTSWIEQERGRFISSGTVEARVPLPLPFREIFAKAGSWKGARTVADHVGDGLFENDRAYCRRSAFEWTLRTARAIQFMAATGLRQTSWPVKGPGSTRDGRGGESRFENLPGQDHVVFFEDPATKRLLMVNEPYENDAKYAVDPRAEWKGARLFDIRRLDWGSLYVAGAGIASEMISLKGHGVDIDEVERRLETFGPALRREDLKIVVKRGVPSPDMFWPEDTTNASIDAPGP